MLKSANSSSKYYATLAVKRTPGSLKLEPLAKPCFIGALLLSCTLFSFVICTALCTHLLEHYACFVHLIQLILQDAPGETPSFVRRKCSLLELGQNYEFYPSQRVHFEQGRALCPCACQSPRNRKLCRSLNGCETGIPEAHASKNSAPGLSVRNLLAWFAAISLGKNTDRFFWPLQLSLSLLFVAVIKVVLQP